MRLGIDVNALGHDRERAGLYHHVLGLLRGLAELTPKPAVTLYVFGRNPDRRRRAEEFVAEHRLGLPVVAYHPPGRRPYRLRAWAAGVRSGLARLDAFLTISCPDFPPGRRRVNAYLIPDLSSRHAAGHHLPGNRDGWEELFAAARANADVVFTYSEHTRRQVIDELGLPAERVAAVPLAAAAAYRPRPEAEVAAPLRELGLAYRGYVLAVGTLEPRKNHLTLFRAYAEYLRRPGAPQLPLAVVGPRGWMDEPILAEPARLGIADKVRFLGRVPDLSAVYAGAAAAAYLSVYEGFGLPPLEAMASGTPTVTSDATSLPEVVGDAGLLVRPDDVTGAADALYRVLTDAVVWADLSARGLRRAAGFSWRATAEGYMAAIRMAAARKRWDRRPAGVA